MPLLTSPQDIPHFGGASPVALERERDGMESKRCAWICSTVGAILPLIPALRAATFSLVERENRLPLRGESNALGSS